MSGLREDRAARVRGSRALFCYYLYSRQRHVRSSRASPQGEFAYFGSQNLQRSLKEAAGELDARLAANNERRFPVMGLRGAPGALMIREMALRLKRPIVAVTSTAPEAEALAGEVAFFLDEPADADAAT